MIKTANGDYVSSVAHLLPTIPTRQRETPEHFANRTPQAVQDVLRFQESMLRID